MNDTKPIRATLRQMEVGQVAQFSIKRLRSVQQTVYEGMLNEKLDGKRWSVHKDLVNRLLEVTRVS